MLNIFQYRNGLQILPVTSLSLDEMGELQVLLSDGKLYYHNGTTISPLVTEAGSTTITNKNFVDNTTFIIDNVDGTIRIGFNASGTAGTTTTIVSSQTVNRVITLPDATDTLVGKATSDTLTNKSISGSTNTLTNIPLTSSVTGILPLANGGTNASTKAGAFDSLSPMTTGGDIIYGGASGTGLRLGNGANGQVLTSSGGTTAPAWMTPSPGFQNPMTTIGDLIIGSTGGAAIRLGATTNGFILTLSGGSPVWASNAGGSAVQTIGTIDSQSKSANGLVITGTSLVAQTADSSFPGMVSITAQTFAGAKTFSTSVKTPTLNDNGAGLTIQPALNQNLTLNTTGAGRIILNGAEGLDMGEQGSSPSNPSAGFSDLYFKTDHLLYSKDSSGNENHIGYEQAVMILDEQSSSPSSPSATHLKFYAKNDDNLYIKNSAGVESVLSSTAVIRSEVWVTGGAGVGATNDIVRRFVTVQTNTGSSITYTSDSTLGDSFTINESGIYTINLTDGANNAILNNTFAISKNATGTALTGNPETTIPFPNKLAFSFNLAASGGSTPVAFLSATTYLNIGDIIRAHANGTNLDTIDNIVSFRITKVNN